MIITEIKETMILKSHYVFGFLFSFLFDLSSITDYNLLQQI